jgi:hypothetical protein
MASHLFTCHERKEGGTLVSTEEQLKCVFHVIKPQKSKKLMYISYINIQAVHQGEGCASFITADR